MNTVSRVTSPKAATPERFFTLDDLHVWTGPNGAIRIQANTVSGEPVVLSSHEARLLADALLRLADSDD